jgi:hypothetical protein
MVATRKSTSDPFGAPVFLKNVNTSGPEWTPDISHDGLTLLFMRNPGPPEIWASTRRTTDDEFGTPIKLPPQVNMPGYDNGMPHLSADGSTLYFLSNRPGGFGGWDLWQVPIIPIVDFNGDGSADGRDVVIMTAHWGQNCALCDIGPLPWGDGVVGVQDLIVLAERLTKEVNDPTLVAHWALDEAEGMIASDSAGGNNGTILGVPIWQPDAGKIGGALEFDGTYFIVADTVLNPTNGPFSVLAWVKGGMPGQAIISQVDGANWLTTEATTGALMTELTSGGRLSRVLCSDTTIVDGNWHRVGLTWDGAIRGLCVDDIVVAEDTQSDVTACLGGLNIGCGVDMTPGTLWNGLVDDVRIYSRAVRP